MLLLLVDLQVCFIVDWWEGGELVVCGGLRGRGKVFGVVLLLL